MPPLCSVYSGKGFIYGQNGFCLVTYLPKIVAGAQEKLERCTGKVKKRGIGKERVYLEDRKKQFESCDCLAVAYLDVRRKRQV